MQPISPHLLDKARAGDHDALDALFGELIDPAFRLALVLLHDRQAAEDAVQEAWLLGRGEAGARGSGRRVSPPRGSPWRWSPASWQAGLACGLRRPRYHRFRPARWPEP